MLEFRAENRVVPLRVLWIGQVSFCLDELGGLLLEKLEGNLSLVLFVLDLVYLSELLLAEVAQVEDELLLGGVGGVEERGLLLFLLVRELLLVWSVVFSELRMNVLVELDRRPQAVLVRLIPRAKQLMGKRCLAHDRVPAARIIYVVFLSYCALSCYFLELCKILIINLGHLLLTRFFLCCRVPLVRHDILQDFLEVANLTPQLVLVRVSDQVLSHLQSAVLRGASVGVLQLLLNLGVQHFERVRGVVRSQLCFCWLQKGLWSEVKGSRLRLVIVGVADSFAEFKGLVFLRAR